MSNKKMTLLNIIIMEWKTKKSILFIQILYNVFLAIKPFIYICFPPLIIDYLVLGEINQTYLVISIFSALSILGDLILQYLYIPYQTNGYILPHQFNKKNLLHLICIDYKYSEQNQSINDYNNSLNYSWQFSSIAYNFISIIISTIVKFALIISIMFTLDIIMIVLIIAVVIISFVINKIKIKINKKYSDVSNFLGRKKEYSTKVLLSLEYGKELRMYPKLHTLFIRKLKNNVNEMEKHNYKVRKFNFVIDFIQNFVSVLQNIFIYLIMIYKYSLEKITLGSFFTYINTANEIYSTFLKLATLGTTIAQFHTYTEAYNKFQSIETISNGSLSCPDNIETIEFRNVSFTYPNTKKEVLHNISFKINKNDKVYLVGNNGSGKTTIVKLLLKLYTPNQGEILVNNINIIEYDYSQYLKMVSVIFQDFKLFKLSIKENICFNNYEKDKFNEVIKLCKLENVICNLPNKENTILDKVFDETGVDLSGGELQKIAIARAIYKDAKFYIFDEPTSALDPIYEQEIINLYNEVSKGKISLIVSHRMSVASICNNIIVIDDGKIIENGSFDDLMKKKGLLYKKYLLQSNYYKN